MRREVTIGNTEIPFYHFRDRGSEEEGEKDIKEEEQQEEGRCR